MPVTALAKRGMGRCPGSAALLLLISPLYGGCFGSAALTAAGSETTGTVDLTSASLGDHTLAPTICASGERQVFLGADFLDVDTGITTRLILDPAGLATLRVFSAADPLGQGLLFRRQDCSRFQLSLERSGWRINDIYDLRVTLDIDCRTASGDSVQGAIAVAHCH